MVEESYVSFETAKLLKEKGFDGRCYKVWEKRYGCEPTILAAPVFVEGETTVDRESVDSAAKYMMNIYSLHNRVDGYLAPTQQMAMSWLRKAYGIYIDINLYGVNENETLEPLKSRIKPYYAFTFWDTLTIENLDKRLFNDRYGDSYEEAVEAAIKYCLENLI